MKENKVNVGVVILAIIFIVLMLSGIWWYYSTLWTPDLQLENNCRSGDSLACAVIRGE